MSLGFESHCGVLVCTAFFSQVFSSRQVVDRELEISFDSIPSGVGIGNFFRKDITKFFSCHDIRDLLKDLVGLHVEPGPQKFDFALNRFCPFSRKRVGTFLCQTKELKGNVGTGNTVVTECPSFVEIWIIWKGFIPFEEIEVRLVT